MAASKTYIVAKDGELLGTYKTLPAAKKAADANGAEVLLGDECVYTGEETPAEEVQETAAPDTQVEETAQEEKAEEEAPEEKKPAEQKKDTYVIKCLMNIRKGPSLTAQKAGLLKPGTLVKAYGVKNDWLCLTDGTFVLYGEGKNAERQ